MKYYCHDTTFDNSWEQTVSAVWQRYPNPFSKHVLSEDTLERRVSGPRLFTKRILMKTNPLPKWGQRFISTRHVAIIEESILDRDQRSFVTYTRNIGCTSTLNVIEKCEYKPANDSITAVSTLLKREAWIVCQLRGFASVIQRFAVERYKHNATNASKGLVFALNKLFPLHLSSHVAKTSTGKLATSAHAVSDLIAQKIENATAKSPAASTM